MDVFHVDIHHFGKFVDGCYQDGDVNHWECDAERWGYFEVIEIVKEMGFKEIDSIWYEASGVTKELVNDRGAMEMVSWSKSNGTVHMYLVHQVSEPTYLAQIDFEPAAQPAEAVVQPQTPTNPTENETQARMHEPEVPRPQSEPVADVEDEGNESDQSVKRIRFNDSEVGKKYTFISDQQKGLLPALDELLPGVEQRFCVRHLYNNFRKKHPGKRLKEIMWRAAKATYPQAWEREMREMRRINEPAYLDLLKIAPRFWSKSRFTENSKCDVLVNNMSETFNSVIVGARQKPIVTMLEEIRGYLMVRWETNRRKIELYNDDILPRIKKRLEKEKDMSRHWLCSLAGNNIYGVIHITITGDKYIVDLNKGTCTCRRWLLTGIPCCHAVACCQQKKIDPEQLVPNYYRKAAYVDCYKSIIYPTNGENLWEETPYPDILPPPLRRPPGRPKRARRKDANERTDSQKIGRKGLQNKCSKCKQFGHNKASCKAQPPPTTQSQTPNSSTTQTQPQSVSTTQPQTQNDSTTQPPTQNASTTQRQTKKASTTQRQTKKASTTQRQPPTTTDATTSRTTTPKLLIKRPCRPWKI